jgi:transcriptional regulator of arginine metabolism
MPVRDEQWEERQVVIRQLLAKRVIRTQGQLLEALRERGFQVTQSSVSRDLSDLKAAKVDGRYRTPEALSSGLPGTELREVATSIRDVKSAGPNLLVVRTPPGRAPIVAVAFDRAGWPQMIGCVAGDDTVFVATQGRGQQSVLEALLARIVREAAHA